MSFAKNIIKAVLCGAVFCVFYSCGDETEKQIRNKNKNIVSRKIYNATITMKDSAYANLKIRAALIEEYGFLDTAYTVCPKGIFITFYKKGNPKPGTLKADYAKFIEKIGWYEAKDHIVLINVEGDTLKTDHLFWNQQTRRIYSDDTVIISRTDGLTKNISIGGLEATEDFKNFKLLKNSGTLPLKNGGSLPLKN